MDLVRAAILGIVQGLSEFLPVSSSGHLILVRALFRWPDQGTSFDVGLHVGTLLALLVYFWRDWLRMIGSGLIDLKDHQLHMASYRVESRLLWLLALGSIPAAVVGVPLDAWFEDNVRQAWVVAITLAVVATVMLLAERYGRRTRSLEEINVRDAVIIGLAQACALVPGVSRSGATISVALFRNLNREDAARFAFLLGTPAFIGAAVFKAKDIANGPLSELLIGFIFSAIVGFIAIHVLLRFLRTHTLMPFIIYRYGLAVVTLLIAAGRIA
jgi:undecaprenyl-diphosphatase